MDFIFLNLRVKNSFQLVRVLGKKAAGAITQIGPFGVHITQKPDLYTFII